MIGGVPIRQAGLKGHFNLNVILNYTGVYVPYYFRIVVWVLLRPTRTR